MHDASAVAFPKRTNTSRAPCVAVGSRSCEWRSIHSSGAYANSQPSIISPTYGSLTQSVSSGAAGLTSSIAPRTLLARILQCKKREGVELRSQGLPARTPSFSSDADGSQPCVLLVPLLHGSDSTAAIDGVCADASALGAMGLPTTTLARGLCNEIHHGVHQAAQAR